MPRICNYLLSPILRIQLIHYLCIARPPAPPHSQAQPQFDSHRNNDSPSSNQFVWPANYLATSTPVTSSSITPVPAANHSPARNYHHHHMVGLPVASTQYRSPYAVPQSSSGSSASTNLGPPPLPGPPPQTSSSFLPPTNYVTHALPVSLKISQYVAFEFWHFPPIFVLLKMTCLVTLSDRKLQVFKNSPKWTIFGIFN